jgi:hypothetical protein
MRAALCVLLLCLPVLAFQSGSKQVTDYGYDINGRRMGPSPNLNGDKAARDEVQERVLEESTGRKVIERITVFRAPDGTVTGKEKAVVEEEKQSDGNSTVRTTVWENDVNGRLVPASRISQVSTKSGDQVNSETRVEKPSINGSFDVAEKRVSTGTVSDSGSERQETIFYNDGNGSMKEAARNVTHETKKGDETTAQTERYEAGPNGRMHLTAQTVSRTAKSSDGSETSVVDIYGTDLNGRSNDTGKLLLRERRFVDITTRPDGSVVESLSVSVPLANDPEKMSAPHKVRESVCKGNCVEAKPAAQAKK